MPRARPCTADGAMDAGDGAAEEEDEEVEEGEVEVVVVDGDHEARSFL